MNTQETQFTNDLVFQKVSEYEREFVDFPVTIAGNYTFSQIETIKKAHLYYNSQFESGPSDKLGKKLFANILKPKVKNAQKNIDLDSKDIATKSKNGNYVYKAWFLRREIEEFNRKRGINKFLNEVVTKTPKYGSFVAKRVFNDDIVRSVDLRNLQLDPTADCLRDSWVSEIHYYTPSELRKMKDWDQEAIRKAIKSFIDYKTENYVDETRTNIKKGNAQYIKVYEHYDWVEEKEVVTGSESEELVLGRFVLILPATGGKKNKAGEGLILDKRKVPSEKHKYLYKECHYDRCEGRWLGVGMMEDGFDMQVFKNDQMNQLRLAMKLANLIVYVTDDETFAANVLKDVVNGDVVRLKGRLQRIPTEVRNYNGNQQVTQEIESLTNSLLNTYEISTGESLPSGTPLGLGQLMNQNANRLFEFVREQLGVFIEEIYNDWVLPELAKSINKKHIIDMTDAKELEWLREQCINSYTWQMVKAVIMKEGRKPTLGEVKVADQILRTQLSSRDAIFFGLPESYFKGWEDDVEIFVTDEKFSKKERMQTLGSIWQMMGTDPRIMQSPVFKQMLDYSGLSEVDVSSAQPEAIEMGQQQPQPQAQPQLQ